VISKTALITDHWLLITDYWFAMPFDPTQRERIRDDLREIVRGEVMFDDISRGLYSTDASIFEVEPLGAVAPLDADDVQAIARYCHANKVPLIARGAGTGMAGESLGDGLVIDLSRHLREIGEIGVDTVRVQPGVVLQRLNAELAKVGRRFAPDPASAATCTVGGMLATNASGSRLLKHGYTRAHVSRLKVVLDNGDSADVGVETMTTTSEASTRLAEIVRGTAALLRQHDATIRAERPATPYNRCGFYLTGVLTDAGLNLPRLLVGSEGTLALFTEATLKTVPLPGGTSVVLLGFDSLDNALKASRLAESDSPSACELLDRRLISLARSSVAESANLLPASVESALLIEFEADRPSEAKRMAQNLVRHIHETEQLSQVAHVALEAAEIDLFWRLRNSALPSLYSLGHGSQPVAIIEDIGVPPDNLGAFLTRVQEVLQRHELTGSFLTHAATGQVHVRPFVDLRNAEQSAKLWPLAEAVYSLVLDMGGTISTQHGTGLARTPWVPKQYGRLYPVFVALKSVFDPNELLNPGKIVSGVSDRPAWPFRAMTLPSAERLPLALQWNNGDLHEQAHACNGCGHCRLEAPPARMCPIFRVTHGEAATPRAKANLLRRVWQTGDPKRLGEDDVRAVADLCVNCKMCASECPAHVNIPKLMLETKAAHHAEHGLDRADWFLSRIELFAALGSRLSLVVNPMLESRAFRWVLERLFGISRHRHLPRFARRSFLRRAARRKLTRRVDGPQKVAYFVDVFANYNDPQIAEAAVAVLRHNGIDVHVPPGQWSCGMASLAMGDVETAKELAEANLRVLAELARDGYRIVCSEPTAALMLSHDYLDLVDDPNAKLVAERTIELTAFLGELLDAGGLRTDFKPLPISVGHHVPCHLKALGRPIVTERLLSLIPQLQVHTIDVSCSGMAGTYGLKRRNYWTSLEAGRPMLEELRRPRVLFGAAECSSCRMQMEEGSGKRALHPVQYLALAYGLMPEIEQRLRQPLTHRRDA
jgi:FAD/FMN-containing dehydrogenase/Fe-S oxidoreductase